MRLVSAVVATTLPRQRRRWSPWRHAAIVGDRIRDSSRARPSGMAVSANRRRAKEAPLSPVMTCGESEEERCSEKVMAMATITMTPRMMETTRWRTSAEFVVTSRRPHLAYGGAIEPRAVLFGDEVLGEKVVGSTSGVSRRGFIEDCWPAVAIKAVLRVGVANHLCGE